MTVRFIALVAIIFGLIVAFVIGWVMPEPGYSAPSASSTPSAAAAPQWVQVGGTYRCFGGYNYVICRETRYQVNYEISFSGQFLGVRYGSRWLYSCERKYRPADNCLTHTGR